MTKMTSLSELMATKVPSLNPANFKDEKFELWSIPSFDKGEPELLSGDEIGSTKKIVKAGDVLLSRIVPHIRRAWVVTANRNGLRQIGSGEWIIFRSNRFDPNYLRHFLTSGPFHSQFMQTVAGVGGSLVRARPDGVKEIEIPLPPLEEQKRIAAILDQADEIRRKRQHAIVRLNQLGQAIFHEMFGDKGTKVRISEYLEDIQSGKNLVGVSDGNESDFRVLKISAVSRMGFRPSETKPLPSNYIPPSEHLVSNGDLIFSRANTTELVGIPCIVEGVEPNVALPDKLWRLVAAPQKADRNFLNFALRSPSSRHQIEKMCSGTSGSMQNISMQKFNSILIPKAALRDQRQFAERAGQVSAVLQQVGVQQRTTNSLFASLQNRAFAGEL